jgi:hypothetical protein
MSNANEAEVGAKPGTAEPSLYFAYGSNMATARLRGRMRSAEPLGLATLAGHELRFHKRSKKDGSGKGNAFATGDDASAVIGVLFSFNPAERLALDEAEGAGYGYEATTVTVIDQAGQPRDALTYLATPNVIDEGLNPYTWYKDHVLIGAREHQLQADYVATWIEAVEAVEDPDRERDRTERATHDV